MSDLNAAAAELVELMEEALATHIYCAEDGERVPANDRHAASIARVRAALGLPASSIELAPVWRFTCLYTNRHGEADDYQEEITADTSDEAMEIGERHARAYLGLTGKINADVVLIAGEVAA